MTTGATRTAGVIGWPVRHSRSPQLHGHWLARYGIDGAYVPLAVRPEMLPTAVRGLAALDFAGVNVTVPHKEAALTLADSVDPTAARIGAANLLVVGDNGLIAASNTDGFGFLAHLRDTVAAWTPADRPVTVIGAGGSSRAILVALADAGVPEIRLVNRTVSRAEQLARDLGGPIRTLDWADRAGALQDVSLIVNTTTQGMAGQEPLDLPLETAPVDAVVYDIVYVPLETPLLGAARARGHPVVDGLGMLLHQARPSFAAWFGIDPVVDEALRIAVLADRG